MLMITLSLAAEPTASVSWSRGTGRVRVEAPPGWHVAPDAPSSITLTADTSHVSVVISTVGDPSTARFPVGTGPFLLDLGFAICEDGASACRPVRFSGSTAPEEDRGSLDLDLVVAAPPTAGGNGVVKVYDFQAVWCPPCTLMAAEVFDAPEHTGTMASWPIEKVDVDLPASWPLKDRYAIGGYPTLVAVDDAGNEVARLVGYPGEAATVGWFTTLQDIAPLHRLVGDTSLTGAAASSAARRLAEAQKPEAARHHFANAEDGVDLRVARLLVDGKAEDAGWLLERATPADTPTVWLHDALTATPARWKEALPLILSLPPDDAAGIYDLLAEHAGGDDAVALRAAAWSLVTSTLTGDPAHDKAQVGFLADLEAAMGQVDVAVARCAEWTARFPAEFTYDHVAARILVDAGQFAPAEALARSAVAKAWGDQKLRAAMTLARALAGQGRSPDAVAVLDAALAEVPAPPEGIEVRTTRYRTQVTELKLGLTKSR